MLQFRKEQIKVRSGQQRPQYNMQYLVRRVALRTYCASSSHSPPINSKLFVGGLSWSIDEKSLKDAFSSFCQVTEDHEAKSVKGAMDGKGFLGRPLRISYALERVRGGPVVVPHLSPVGETSN